MERCADWENTRLQVWKKTNMYRDVSFIFHNIRRNDYCCNLLLNHFFHDKKLVIGFKCFIFYYLITAHS